MEAKSSIHIEKGKRYYFFHNDRTYETSNSIFDKKDNIYSCNAKEALKNFTKEIKLRKIAYEKRVHQKLQKNAMTHLSAIVNIKSTTTKEDIEKLVKYIEDKLDTKVIQYVIHKDEGHIKNKDLVTKEHKVNYHAHIELLGIDSDGASIRKKLSRKFLSELQTETAKILKMQRGVNYAKEEKPRPKRLNTYEYKKHKEDMEKLELKYKAKLYTLHDKYSYATRSNKRLSAELKQKDIFIETLQSKIKDLQELITALEQSAKKEKKASKNFIKVNINKIKGVMKKYKYTRSDYAILEQEMKTLKNTNTTQAEVIKKLKALSKKLILKQTDAVKIDKSKEIVTENNFTEL